MLLFPLVHIGQSHILRDMSVNLDKGQSVVLQSPNLFVGLAWDILDKSVQTDLDVSCVLYNTDGKIIDACYYNQLTIENGAIKHSGDNQTGLGEGFDESIQVDLTKIKSNCKALMFTITCSRSGNFKNVETARASIFDMNLNVELVSLSLGCNGNHTALIVACVYKDENGIWNIRNISTPSLGRNFKQCQRYLQDALTFLIPKELMLEMKWDPSQTKPFKLQKGNSVKLSGDRVKLGLGWDSRVDLDSSCVIYSKENVSENTSPLFVYFGNKNYEGAVVHSGDNTTGEGSGDDETIMVNLSKLPTDKTCLVFTITIYTGGYTFEDVKGEYCRLIDVESGREMCRYNLDQGTYNCNALLMCKLEKNENGEWIFTALGKRANGNHATQLHSQILPMVHQHVKLDEGDDFVMDKEAIKRRDAQEKDYIEKSSKLALMEVNLKDAPKEIDAIPTYSVEVAPKAVHLPKVDILGQCDGYFKLYDHRGSKKCESGVKKKTLNPVWDHYFWNFSEPDLMSPHKIEIWDWNAILEHSLVGSFSFKPQDLIDSDGKDFVAPILNKKGNSAGEFHFGEICVKKDVKKVANPKLAELEKLRKEVTDIETKLFAE